MRSKKGKKGGRDIRKIPRRLFRANAAQGTLIFMGFHILRETRDGSGGFF